MVVARVAPHEQPPDLGGLGLCKLDEVPVMSTHRPLAKPGLRLSWEMLSYWFWPLPSSRSRATQDKHRRTLGLALPSNVIETGDIMLTWSLMRRMPLVSTMPEHVARMAAQLGAR